MYYIIKKIGIITSGGDSPGMNAALRSVVRSANFHSLNCIGFFRGYQGIIENDFKLLEMRSVSNILELGGTILRSMRSLDFHNAAIREKAYDNLKSHNIDALIVIGGNGSITGANVFSKQFDFPCIGIPASIDNDIYGTDYSIGFQTALQTIVESVDKIRDTARSHNRLFFVEVMGRDNGNLALYSAIASGSCFVIIPEKDFEINNLAERLKFGKSVSKSSSVVIVAEGNNYGPAYKIADDLSEIFDEYESKVTILGHLQRGGSPVVMDRLIASRLGLSAVQALISKNYNQMVGIIKNELVLTPIQDVVSKEKKLNTNLYKLNKIISR
ncbi:MAG: 6-phosphofructokinase [Flavobacteriales bacterium]|nr:6-phosphofructokinase [Flavobacteriales bacterium]